MLPLASSINPFIAQNTFLGLFIGTLSVLVMEHFRSSIGFRRMVSFVRFPLLLACIEMMLFHPFFFSLFNIREFLLSIHAHIFFSGIAVLIMLKVYSSAQAESRQSMLLVWKIVIAFLLGVAGVSLAGDYQGQHFFVMVSIYLSIILVCMNAMSLSWEWKPVRYLCGIIISALLIVYFAAPLQHELYSLKDYNKNLAAHKTQRMLLEERAAGIDAILTACGVDRYLTLDNGLYIGLTYHTPLNFYFWPMLESAVFDFHPIVGSHTIQNIKSAQIAFASAPDSVVIATGLQKDTDDSLFLLLQNGVKLIETPWPCAENLPEPPGLKAYYRDLSY